MESWVDDDISIVYERIDPPPPPVPKEEDENMELGDRRNNEHDEMNDDDEDEDRLIIDEGPGTADQEPLTNSTSSTENEVGDLDKYYRDTDSIKSFSTVHDDLCEDEEMLKPVTSNDYEDSVDSNVIKSMSERIMSANITTGANAATSASNDEYDFEIGDDDDDADTIVGDDHDSDSTGRESTSSGGSASVLEVGSNENQNKFIMKLKDRRVDTKGWDETTKESSKDRKSSKEKEHKKREDRERSHKKHHHHDSHHHHHRHGVEKSSASERIKKEKEEKRYKHIESRLSTVSKRHSDEDVPSRLKDRISYSIQKLSTPCPVLINLTNESPRIIKNSEEITEAITDVKVLLESVTSSSTTLDQAQELIRTAKRALEVIKQSKIVPVTREVCKFAQPEFSFTKWANDKGGLSMKKIGDLAVGKALSPLACTYDRVLEKFFFSGCQSVMSCDLEGNVSNNKIGGLDNPTALVIVRPGESIAILDRRKIYLYVHGTKTLHTIASRLDDCRSLCCTPDGNLVTCERKGPRMYAVLYDTTHKDKILQTLLMYAEVGANVCFSTSSSDLLYFTDLGLNKLTCLRYQNGTISPYFSRRMDGDQDGGFRFMSGLISDKHGYMLMADARAQCLKFVTPAGQYLSRMSHPAGEFPYCSSFSISPDGHLLACDRRMSRMVLLRIDGSLPVVEEKHPMDELLADLNLTKTEDADDDVVMLDD